MNTPGKELPTPQFASDQKQEQPKKKGYFNFGWRSSAKKEDNQDEKKKTGCWKRANNDSKTPSKKNSRRNSKGSAEKRNS